MGEGCGGFWGGKRSAAARGSGAQGRRGWGTSGRAVSLAAGALGVLSPDFCWLQLLRAQDYRGVCGKLVKSNAVIPRLWKTCGLRDFAGAR